MGKRRIMVVDDALFMQNMLKNILEEMEYDVVGTASNGREAIEKVQTLNPEIITMDITMPDMDGIEALKEIKKINDQVKIIMCSAMGQKNFVLEAVQSGAVDFIVKPFERSKIAKALNNVETILRSEGR
ncbi:MAG: response regulator [Peptostreptococcaceae bacterium]|jgi:two-component system chemotaxis response regulator CheY|nr:response regulator [Peptostreptococcaceae bacterium]